jgi:hypothetical protein
MTAIPNNAIKPIAAETLNGVPVSKSAKTPPIIAMGMTAMPRRVSVKEAKLTYSNVPISRIVRGDNHPEALDRVLEVAEFADPFQAIACAQRDFLCNLSLCLEYRAAQIPPANAEFDIALLLFAVDERRAGHQVDARDLAEGYPRAKAAIACSISPASRTPIGVSSTPNEGATV